MLYRDLGYPYACPRLSFDNVATQEDAVCGSFSQVHNDKPAGCFTEFVKRQYIIN